MHSLRTTTIIVYYRRQTKLREGNGFTPVSYSVQRGCIPACNWTGVCVNVVCVDRGVQPPPPRYNPGTATAAGSMYPTGMHSCINLQMKAHKFLYNSYNFFQFSPIYFVADYLYDLLRPQRSRLFFYQINH